MKSLKPVNSVFTDYVLARSYKHLSLQIFILSLGKKKSQKGGKSTSVHRVMQANFKKKKKLHCLTCGKK